MNRGGFLPANRPSTKAALSSSPRKKSKTGTETSLAVPRFRLPTSTAEGTGSIPGQGTKIPTSNMPGSQKKKKEKKTGKEAE